MDHNNSTAAIKRITDHKLALCNIFIGFIHRVPVYRLFQFLTSLSEYGSNQFQVIYEKVLNRKNFKLLSTQFVWHFSRWEFGSSERRVQLDNYATKCKMHSHCSAYPLLLPPLSVAWPFCFPALCCAAIFLTASVCVTWQQNGQNDKPL